MSTLNSSLPSENDEATPSWYPSSPRIELPSEINLNKLTEILATIPKPIADVHPIWSSGELKYLTSSKWNSIPNDKRESCRRNQIHGVEIQQLPSNHFLSGEYGLFATQKFSIFDVLGISISIILFFYLFE